MSETFPRGQAARMQVVQMHLRLLKSLLHNLATWGITQWRQWSDATQSTQRDGSNRAQLCAEVVGHIWIYPIEKFSMVWSLEKYGGKARLIPTMDLYLSIHRSFWWFTTGWQLLCLITTIIGYDYSHRILKKISAHPPTNATLQSTFVNFLTSGQC